MDKIVFPDWSKHQHYKDRSPLWIKIYRSLLVNFNFMSLTPENQSLLFLLWLVASEQEEQGTIPLDLPMLQFRLNRKIIKVDDLKTLELKGFLIIKHDASILPQILTEEEQLAILETEKRREEERQRREEERQRREEKRAAQIATFNSFWMTYPKKQSKAETFIIWERDNLDEVYTEIMDGLNSCIKYNEAWKRDRGKFIAHPSTWLNQKRWMDDFTPPLLTPDPKGKELSASEIAKRMIESIERKENGNQGSNGNCRQIGGQIPLLDK